MNLDDLDKVAIGRFQAHLESLWPEGGADPSLRLGLAVSGGADSCALLLLAAATLPGRIEAATVDHGLRPESGEEALFVAQLCDDLRVPHRILAVEIASGNVQAQARSARYRALGEWSQTRFLSALATAHHADDQAETLIMRLNRASGVAGLAGVRARSVASEFDLPLLRPVLDWRRSELVSLVEQVGICAIEDPSNVDDRFDRARLRKALTDADWLDPAAVARSAAHLADADVALTWAAEREWDICVVRRAGSITYRPQAPRAIVLRVVMRIVTELDDAPARGSAIATLVEALEAGRAASIGGLIARKDAQGWHFARAPARKS